MASNSVAQGWSGKRVLVAYHTRTGHTRTVAEMILRATGGAFTSPDITDWKGHKCGTNYCAQGNTLTGPDVVLDMAAAFETTEGHWPNA